MRCHAFIRQCLLTPFLPTLQSYRNFGWGEKFSLWCNQNDTAPFTDREASGYRLARVLWIHYVSKAYEFGDTIIMILKKNNRQVGAVAVVADSSRDSITCSPCTLGPEFHCLGFYSSFCLA